MSESEVRADEEDRTGRSTDCDFNSREPVRDLDDLAAPVVLSARALTRG
jgi:hypothetical protein